MFWVERDMGEDLRRQRAIERCSRSDMVKAQRIGVETGGMWMGVDGQTKVVDINVANE